MILRLIFYPYLTKLICLLFVGGIRINYLSRWLLGLGLKSVGTNTICIKIMNSFPDISGVSPMRLQGVGNCAVCSFLKWAMSVDKGQITVEWEQSWHFEGESLLSEWRAIPQNFSFDSLSLWRGNWILNLICLLDSKLACFSSQSTSQYSCSRNKD